MTCMCVYSTDGWSQVSKSPQLGTWTGHLHQLHRASSPQPLKSRRSLMVRWAIIFMNRSRSSHCSSSSRDRRLYLPTLDLAYACMRLRHTSQSCKVSERKLAITNPACWHASLPPSLPLSPSLPPPPLHPSLRLPPSPLSHSLNGEVG